MSSSSNCSGTRFVFIDTEATGLDLDRHELTEVAWIVRFEDGTEVERQYFPDHTIDGADEFALELTEYHTRIAPQPKTPMAEWLHQFLADAQDAVLVGAVPDFDARQLHKACRKLAVEPTWDHHLLDVETLALPLIAAGPEAPRSLGKTCAALGIPHDKAEAHGALYDARQAMAVFDKVWQVIAELRADDRPLPDPVPLPPRRRPDAESSGDASAADSSDESAADNGDEHDPAAPAPAGRSPDWPGRVTPQQRVRELRTAANWLFWATLVIVVDFRIGGSGGGFGGAGSGGAGVATGVDVFNDVIGAALVVVGIDRLRHGAEGTPGTRPWTSWAWVAALVNVPLVLVDEALRTVGDAPDLVHTGLELLAIPVVFGGTAAAATVFRHTLATHTTETDLAERWRRVVPWMLFVGAIPAVIAALVGAGVALGGAGAPTWRGTGPAAGGIVIVVVVGALALGLAALVVLLTALSRTRQLPDPVAPPANGSDASAW